MRMIITQVGHPSFRGGGNTVAHELASALSRRGHKVTAVFVAPKSLYKRNQATSYKLVLLKQSWFLFLNALHVAFALRRLFREEGGDVILSFGYEGVFVPKIKKKRLFIAATHNFLRPIGWKNFLHFKWLNPSNWGKFLYELQVYLDKKTKQRADAVQALCEFGKKQLESFYNISSKKVFIVPNGVKSKTPFTRSKILETPLLFMGGSSHHKGLDVLLEALPAIIKEHPEVRLIVLGEMKREEKGLILIARKLGVMRNILWRGLVSQDEMPKFYEKTYISVFPSRLDTFPLGILESMAYGIPVVATKVGGIPEIVENNRSGVLVLKENPEDLAQALIELLNNPEKVKMMGLRARKIAQDRFSWEKVAEEFEKKIHERTTHMA